MRQRKLTKKKDHTQYKRRKVYRSLKNNLRSVMFTNKNLKTWVIKRNFLLTTNSTVRQFNELGKLRIHKQFPFQEMRSRLIRDDNSTLGRPSRWLMGRNRYRDLPSCFNSLNLGSNPNGRLKETSQWVYWMVVNRNEKGIQSISWIGIKD